MKNQKGISLIALIITIIVIIILAAIVITRAMGTVDSANKAKFDQEFSDFASAVVSKGLDLYAKVITSGYTTDGADYYYMAAQNKSVTDMVESNNFKHLTEDSAISPALKNTAGSDSDAIVEIDEFPDVTYNGQVYKFPSPRNSITTFVDKDTDDVNDDDVVYCYKIDSSKLDGYMNPAKPNFHGMIGSNSGSPTTAESHWITESGKVFTYPGYFYDGNLYITNTVTYSK